MECAAGCGHRLYSDRGRLECPCHWPAAKVAQIALTSCGRRGGSVAHGIICPRAGYGSQTETDI